MAKILIAEDDKFLSSAYKVKLSKAGFEVQMARDGEEALTVLQTFTPDLIILDLMMPVKDGFSVLETIRKDDQFSQFKVTPVIVASNLGQKEDTDRAMSLGANDFLVKSDLSLDIVIEKINKLIGA
jgi:DNA-binding response OmpR family regulator